ncbi:hypothetical protein [Streptomyces katsurahamanus]|uniref:hypothetical protein n=1 Tax=Streptomyces katsurahamanus TaxID=2577098 RepID=UPI002B203CD1|nr:hypothetical protein [Streptomyces katsurahamanus]
MSDVSFLRRPGALTDIGIEDAKGRFVTAHAPVMATPAVAAGVIIGVALVNAFVAGRDGGPLEPTVPEIGLG